MPFRASALRLQARQTLPKSSKKECRPFSLRRMRLDLKHANAGASVGFLGRSSHEEAPMLYHVTDSDSCVRARTRVGWSFW